MSDASPTPTAGGAPGDRTSSEVLLEVHDLKVHFPITKGILIDRVVGHVKAVDGVSFYVREGETLGLVGESGSGKTTTGRMILRAHEPTAGEVWFADREMGQINIAELEKPQLKRLRRNIQMIFQDPYSSLNPRMTLLQIVGEPLLVNYCRRTSGALSALNVSPNPAHGELRLRYMLETDRSVAVSLYDIHGAYVRELIPATSVHMGLRTESVQLGDVRPGVYMVVLRSDQGEQVSERMIVQ